MKLQSIPRLIHLKSLQDNIQTDLGHGWLIKRRHRVETTLLAVDSRGVMTPKFTLRKLSPYNFNRKEILGGGIRNRKCRSTFPGLLLTNGLCKQHIFMFT